MAGSPERGGCLREEEGGRSSVVHEELLLPPAQHGEGMGREGKQRTARADTPLSVPSGSVPHCTRELGKLQGWARGNTPQYVSSCPGHPCQVLIET